MNDTELEKLDKYLPWPEAAITAYTVYTYPFAKDISLVAQLQEKMGKWISNRMHSLERGLSSLPNAFALEGDMEGDIIYSRFVNKVEYDWTNDLEKKVMVSGVITKSGQPFSIEGRSVMFTPTLNIIRGIQIVDIRDRFSKGSASSLPNELQKAIQDISYSPCTKIMLQYRKKFWNTGKHTDTDITGGFSKTTLPIGQLYYPSDVQIVPNMAVDGRITTVWEPARVTEDQKGILIVYSSNNEAHLLSALEEDVAIRLAVQQVDAIHAGVNTTALFETGYRQAWSIDPTTLGAYVELRPREHSSVMYLMQNSWKNVYFAGEAISFTNGWIQGALESGVRAAYQLFRDDHSAIQSPVSK